MFQRSFGHLLIFLSRLQCLEIQSLVQDKKLPPPVEVIKLFAPVFVCPCLWLGIRGIFYGSGFHSFDQLVLFPVFRTFFLKIYIRNCGILRSYELIITPIVDKAMLNPVMSSKV